MAELETVDIPAVEILATGGPVFGQGSPVGGDYYTRDQLEEIAAANRELAAELDPPMKIGHSDAQTLLKNSNLPMPTPGEMPAVGWLDGATARVIDDPDTGGAKLVMDARKVPKAFSQLIDVGAYRKRSGEMLGKALPLGEVSSFTSQASQKTYKWVVTGLAWLGAKLPAVQTLQDVIALYEAAGLELPAGTPRAEFRAFAIPDGQIVWEPGSSFQSLRDHVSEALNGPPTGGMTEPRYWVSDISLDAASALVCDYYDDGQDGYVVPFTRAADGSVRVAPSSDWRPVEQGWIASARELEQRLIRENRRAAESSVMELTLTDDQAAAVRAQLGIDADTDVTAESLVEAAEARANELAEAKRKADEAEQRRNEHDGELERRLEQTERRLFERDRDADLEKAIREGRLNPADREKWEKRFEADAMGPDAAREVLFELPVQEEFLREFGVDGDGDEATVEEKRNLEAQLAEIFPDYDPQEVAG